MDADHYQNFRRETLKRHGCMLTEHLLPGDSRETVSHNIKTEQDAGKPHDQAVAIALHHADEYR